MEVTFDKIHEVVIEALSPNKEFHPFLKIIGNWYFKFLNSNEDKLILQIPKHEEVLTILSYNYVRLFSLTYRLINREELKNFKNTCLFNIFDFSIKNENFSNKNRSTYEFVKEEGGIIYWTNNTLTPKNRFLPIFIQEQIEKEYWDDTYNTFRLFSIIENKELINYPVLIDYKDDLCLSLSNSEDMIIEDFAQFRTINWNAKKSSQEDAIEIEDELLTQNFSHQVAIKYPYHNNIHSYLLEIGAKKIILDFNTRFHYQNISNEEIYLLPNEFEDISQAFSDVSSCFNILNTEHSPALFKALNEFKSAWQAYDFNKFTTPFPKYWFLFINQSIDKEDWFEMFKTDYPDVSDKPIINTIKIIIDLIYELNWSKQFIENEKELILLLPELRGINKKKLEKSLTSFKNYLLSINSNLVFAENNESYEYNIYNNLLILDGFNIINLFNILQKNNKVRILIPDFLYFNYQPWIKYFLLNFQFDALLNLKREILDENYFVNFKAYTKLKEVIIKEIKSDITSYRKKYNIKEEDIVLEEITSSFEDMIFRNNEELDLNILSKTKINLPDFQIETFDNKIYILKSNTQILLQRTSLISCPASSLKLGDIFITINEINSVIDKDVIINKLSRIPDTVINFQIELGKKLDVYQTLAKQGLVYNSEKYFNDTYVLNNNHYTIESFKLPKKKDNWKIICEYLGINNSDLNQTWISYYGRKHSIRIKDLYRNILNLCIDGEFLSELENPNLIKKITKILDDNMDIFDEVEGTNSNELAKSIVSAIVNEISFHQVKEIKSL
jgi:hypothetical protein